MRGGFRDGRVLRRLVGTAALAALVASAGCSDEPDADSAGDTDPRPGKTAGVEERAGSAESADEERDAGDPPGQTEAEKLTPPDEPEPVIDLTGPVDEIERIYREQNEYRSWLFRHPDPANIERLARITHRQCPCWEAAHELMARYAKHRRWWSGATIEIVDLKLVEQPARNVVVLHVTGERNGSATLIDESGRVHSELPPERRVQEITLRRGTFDQNRPHRDRSDDPWKVITVHDLDEGQPANDDGQ